MKTIHAVVMDTDMMAVVAQHVLQSHNFQFHEGTQYEGKDEWPMIVEVTVNVLVPTSDPDPEFAAAVVTMKPWCRIMIATQKLVGGSGGSEAGK